MNAQILKEEYSEFDVKFRKGIFSFILSTLDNHLTANQFAYACKTSPLQKIIQCANSEVYREIASIMLKLKEWTEENL